MTRSRATARQAGTAFERLIADHLAAVIDDRIERRTLGGSRDRGEVAGVRLADGRRVVLECKDWSGRIDAATWVREAQLEASNDAAAAGVVIAKRRGTTRPEEQWVLMTVAELVTLLGGAR